MLGAQNAKTKHPANLIPPKLQRIPKSDSTDAQTRSPSRIAKVPPASPSLPLNVDKKDSGWFPQTENDFLQSHDGTVPKPAQNIAVMGGKKYIVVPKNNAMAVQPAITVKPDMIGDKPPTLHDSSLIDISNTVDSGVAKLRAPPAKHPDADLGSTVEFEKAKVTPDKETESAKDDAEEHHHLADIASAANVDEISEALKNKDTAKEVDRPIENASDNESSTANVDHVPESETAHTSCRSPENESATPVHTASTPNALETTSAEAIDVDCQQSLSSHASTVTIKNRM